MPPTRLVEENGKRAEGAVEIEFPVRVKSTLRLKKGPGFSCTGFLVEALHVYFVTRGIVSLNDEVVSGGHGVCRGR